LTWWVTKKPEDREESDEKILSQISAGQAKLTQTIALTRTLADLIRQRQPKQLEAWLEEAERSGYPVWKKFCSRYPRRSGRGSNSVDLFLVEWAYRRTH
jgi:transposase